MTREEAIKILRDTHDKALFSVRNALETLIPELRESEDERIRQMIENTLRDAVLSERISETSYREMSAYLEKQKDASKATEAVERIDKYIDQQVANAHDMEDSNPDKKYYLGWDDALGEISGILKDVYSGEKQKEQKPVDDVSKEEYVKRFKALCDAYEIKLPNREYDIYHLCDDLSKLSIDSDKQKPAEWSEEDEDYMKDLMDYFGHNLPLEHTPHAVRDWLKDLPNRITLQPKQEWSEEDEKMLNNLIWTVHMKSISPCDEMDDGNVYEKYENFLKSLRPSWKPSEQEKGALRTAIYVLTEEKCFHSIAQLKNILNAFEGKEPRKDWKPSEEQMDALADATMRDTFPTVNKVLLESLYEQLKKL